MAAATTEGDQTAAFASLEALEVILRACKGKPQIEGKTTKELLQGIQDFLTKQVTQQLSIDNDVRGDNVHFSHQNHLLILIFSSYAHLSC